MRLSKLSLKWRLYLGYGSLLALLMVVAAWTTMVIRDQGNNTESLVQTTLPRQLALSRLSTLVDRYRSAQYAHISALVPEEQGPIEASMRSVSLEIQQTLQKLGESTPDEHLVQLLSAFANSWKSYVGFFEAEVLPISKDSLGNIAVRKMSGPHELAYKHLHELLAQSSVIATSQATQLADDSVQMASRAQRLNIGICLAALVLGWGIALATLRAVNRPIAMALELAQGVASGDLTNRMTAEQQGDDELSALLKALDAMRLRLAQLVQEIRTAAQAVGDASREIVSSQRNLAAFSQAMAGQRERALDLMTHAEQAQSEGVAQARHVEGYASEAATLAVSGGQSVDIVVTSMRSIRESGGAISNVLDFIGRVSQQTNLLAMNAATAAAHAGEHGKAFAVIANEVRTLAMSSKTSADEIRSLVAGSIQRIDHGAEQAETAGERMAEVVGRARSMAERVQALAQDAVVQHNTMLMVAAELRKMGEETRRAELAVQGSGVAVTALEAQAFRLKQSVDAFVVDHHELTPDPKQVEAPSACG